MENSKTIKYVLIAIIIGLAILFLYKKQENLDASGLSNEALQNIASVYNNNNMTVTNLTTTGDANIGSIHFDKKGFNSKNMFFNNDTSEFNTRGKIGSDAVITKYIDNTTGYTKLWDVSATKFKGAFCNQDNGSPCLFITQDGKLKLRHDDGRESIKDIF